MKQTILIAEDENDVVNLVRRNVEAAGCSMIGTEAIAKTWREQPALVTPGLMLPELSGIEVCRNLKSNATTAEIQIDFKLLSALIKRRGIVQSREKLLNDVWGYDVLSRRGRWTRTCADCAKNSGAPATASRRCAASAIG